MSKISRRDILSATAGGTIAATSAERARALTRTTIHDLSNSGSAVDLTSNAQVFVAALDKDLVPTSSASVTTVSAFTSSSFGKATSTVSILGYHTVGVGALLVRRVNFEPSHPWKFRSKDRYLANDTTDKTNGGWWEGYPHDGMNVYIEQFGAVVDGVTDDLPAFTMAFRYLQATKVSGTQYPGSYTSYILNLAKGDCYVSDTIVIPLGIMMKGLGNGTMGAAKGSRILVPYGHHGIKISYIAGTKLIDFGIEAVGTLNAVSPRRPPGNYDGVICHGASEIVNISVRGFQRHGINITASMAKVLEEEYGNANGFSIERCALMENGNCGIYIKGADANAGMTNGCNFVSNGFWALRDDSFLGNYHCGHQSAYDGSGSVSQFNKVPFVVEGGYFWTVRYGQEVAAETSRPSTSPSVWCKALFDDGSGTADESTNPSIPMWGRVYCNGLVYLVQAGQEANMWNAQPNTHPTVWGTGQTPVLERNYIRWINGWAPYASGGPYCISNPNAQSTLQNCYVEGNLYYCYFSPQVMVWNGVNVANQPGNAVAMISTEHGTSGALIAGLYSTVSGTSAGERIRIDWGGGGPANNSGIFMSMKHSALNNSFRMQIGSGGIQFNYAGLDTAVYYVLTSYLSTSGFGRFSNAGGAFFIPKFFPGGPRTAGRQFGYAPAPPRASDGEFAFGDAFLNDGGSTTAIMGWRCVSAGTPGSWQAFYASPVPNYGAVALSALPSAATAGAGARAVVTDSNATLRAGLGNTVASGGSYIVPVFSDGTNWIIG